MDIGEFLNITLRPRSLSGTYCHCMATLSCRSVFLFVCLFVFIFVSKFSVYITQCELFLLLISVNYTSVNRCPVKFSVGLHRKKVIHQKYYLFLYYIFASMKLL